MSESQKGFFMGFSQVNDKMLIVVYNKARAEITVPYVEGMKMFTGSLQGFRRVFLQYFTVIFTDCREIL